MEPLLSDKGLAVAIHTLLAVTLSTLYLLVMAQANKGGDGATPTSASRVDGIVVRCLAVAAVGPIGDQLLIGVFAVVSGKGATPWRTTRRVFIILNKESLPLMCAPYLHTVSLRRCGTTLFDVQQWHGSRLDMFASAMLWSKPRSTWCLPETVVACANSFVERFTLFGSLATKQVAGVPIAHTSLRQFCLDNKWPLSALTNGVMAYGLNEIPVFATLEEIFSRCSKQMPEILDAPHMDCPFKGDGLVPEILLPALVLRSLLPPHRLALFYAPSVPALHRLTRAPYTMSIADAMCIPDAGAAYLYLLHGSELRHLFTERLMLVKRYDMLVVALLHEGMRVVFPPLSPARTLPVGQDDASSRLDLSSTDPRFEQVACNGGYERGLFDFFVRVMRMESHPCFNVVKELLESMIQWTAPAYAAAYVRSVVTWRRTVSQAPRLRVPWIEVGKNCKFEPRTATPVQRALFERWSAKVGTFGWYVAGNADRLPTETQLPTATPSTAIYLFVSLFERPLEQSTRVTQAIDRRCQAMQASIFNISFVETVGALDDAFRRLRSPTELPGFSSVAAPLIGQCSTRATAVIYPSGLFANDSGDLSGLYAPSFWSTNALRSLVADMDRKPEMRLRSAQFANVCILHAHMMSARLLLDVLNAIHALRMEQAAAGQNTQRLHIVGCAALAGPFSSDKEPAESGFRQVYRLPSNTIADLSPHAEAVGHILWQIFARLEEQNRWCVRPRPALNVRIIKAGADPAVDPASELVRLVCMECQYSAAQMAAWKVDKDVRLVATSQLSLVPRSSKRELFLDTEQIRWMARDEILTLAYALVRTADSTHLTFLMETKEGVSDSPIPLLVAQFSAPTRVRATCHWSTHDISEVHAGAYYKL